MGKVCVYFVSDYSASLFLAGRGGNTTKALAMELRSKACRVSRHHCTSHAALESPSFGDASSPWALASLYAASFSRSSYVMCWLSVTAFPRAGASHRPSGSARPPRRRAILGARRAKGLRRTRCCASCALERSRCLNRIDSPGDIFVSLGANFG